MKVYTRALRVPALVGKIPGGGRLVGGPYTMTQFVGGSAALLLGMTTVDSVLQMGWIGNRVIVLCAVAGVVFGLGVIKPGGRDPVSAAMAMLGVYSAPRAGRTRGRPIRLPRPHLVRHRVAADIPLWVPAPQVHLPLPAPAAAAVRRTGPHMNPGPRMNPGTHADTGTAAQAPVIALTGVARLLAQATKGPSDPWAADRTAEPRTAGARSGDGLAAHAAGLDARSTA